MTHTPSVSAAVLGKPRVRKVTWCRVNLKLYKIKNSMEEVPLELDLEGQIKP